MSVLDTLRRKVEADVATKAKQERKDLESSFRRFREDRRKIIWEAERRFGVPEDQIGVSRNPNPRSGEFSDVVLWFDDHPVDVIATTSGYGSGRHVNYYFSYKGINVSSAQALLDAFTPPKRLPWHKRPLRS